MSLEKTSAKNTKFVFKASAFLTRACASSILKAFENTNDKKTNKKLNGQTRFHNKCRVVIELKICVSLQLNCLTEVCRKWWCIPI